MEFILNAEGLIFFLLLLFLRVRISFSLTAMWPEGIVAGVIVAPAFGTLRISASFGLVKREKWVMYYRIGNGKAKEIRPKTKADEPVKKKKSFKLYIKSISIKALKSALEILELRLADVHIQLGMEDAAKCAITCGAVGAALEGFLSYFCSEWSMLVTPKFNSKIIRLDLTGILIVKTENIMTSAYQMLIKMREVSKNERIVSAKGGDEEEDNSNAVSASN